MTISQSDWNAYITRLRRINEQAAKEMTGWMKQYGLDDVDALINHAYAVVNKYGTASSQLAADMYDATAELSGKYLEPAELAEMPTYRYVSGTIRRALNLTQNIDMIAAVAGRLVKQAAQDTTLKNAKRDGAQFAWIPHGATCAFCIMLGSNGWKNISKQAFKNGHARHIHPNCDCAYAVRFDSESNIDGYDPDAMQRFYYSSIEQADESDHEYEGKKKNYAVNAMRRRIYKQNKEQINAQKRSAYEKRKELESPKAEELKV